MAHFNQTAETAVAASKTTGAANPEAALNNGTGKKRLNCIGKKRLRRAIERQSKRQRCYIERPIEAPGTPPERLTAGRTAVDTADFLDEFDDLCGEMEIWGAQAELRKAVEEQLNEANARGR